MSKLKFSHFNGNHNKKENSNINKMDKLASSSHDDEKSADNNDDFKDWITSYDNEGKEAFIIESSDYVEVSTEEGNTLVLVLREGNRGICPSVDCYSGLKCGVSYIRADDLRKHLGLVHFFKLDDNFNVKFSTKKPRSMTEKREGDRNRKRVKKLHSLGFVDVNTDLRAVQSTKCQYLDINRGDKPCTHMVLGFRYCPQHITKSDKEQLNRNVLAMDTQNPFLGLSPDPITNLGGFVYSKLGYGPGEAICYYRHSKDNLPVVLEIPVHEVETDLGQVSWSAYMKTSNQDFNALVELNLQGICVV